MSEFLELDAVDAELEQGEEEEDHFIDDQFSFNDQEPSHYRSADIHFENYQFANDFQNFEESIYAFVSNVAISDERAMSVNSPEDYDQVDNISNFNIDNHLLALGKEDEFEETASAQSRIEKFEKTLKQKCEKSKDSFCNAVVWGVYSKLKTDNFPFDDDDDGDDDDDDDDDDEKLEKVLDLDFFQKIKEIKKDKVPDINTDTFEQKLHLMMSKNVFKIV